MLSVYDFFTNYVFPSDPEKGELGSINLMICLTQASGFPLFGARDESKTFRIVMSIYSIFVVSILTCIYYSLEIYDLIEVWGDLSEVSRNTCMSFTHLAGILKMINTLSRKNDVLRVIEQFKIMTRKYVTSEKQKKELDWSEFENKVSWLIYFTIVIFTALLAMVFLFLNPEKVARKLFPYRVKMPEFLPFRLQLVYMGTSVITLTAQVVAMDYINIVLINQTRYQMKVINIALDSLNSADTTTARANEIINSVVEHHNWILELRDDIESIFKYTVLIQFITSLMIFALTGFQVTVQSNSSGAILVYLYCGCIFCQLFVYCWYGNEVSEHNKTLALSGYNAPWYNFDKKFRKSLIIFLINAQQPFVLTAGGFTTLSLTTFSGILSKSYTYIAVLRQMYSE